MILAKAPARKRLAIYGALAGLLLTSGVPAMAQDNDSSRIRKLEAEIRALQRRVFPGGDGRYFEPEISGPANSGPNASTQTTAVTDILARLDALEASIQSLTRQVEVATNTQTGIEQRLAVLENATATGGAPAALLPAGNVVTLCRAVDGARRVEHGHCGHQHHAAGSDHADADARYSHRAERGATGSGARDREAADRRCG